MDMKIRAGVFVFFLVLIYAFLPPSAFGEDRVHIVQRGETFFSIARAFGVKAEDLMRHNGITDPTRLMAGQRLRVPSVVSAGVGGFTNYRVVRGDTLFGIARNFSVTVTAIQEANNFSQNHVLREGQTIRIPTGVVENRVPVVVTPSRAPEVSLRWPVTAREISYMTGKLEGVVITGLRSEPVISLSRGTVLSAGLYRGFGRVVIVQSEGGYLYVYGGCETLSVREGDRVGPGSELGKLGVDAVSNKPQLFFMVYRSNMPIDPATAPRA